MLLKQLSVLFPPSAQLLMSELVVIPDFRMLAIQELVLFNQSLILLLQGQVSLAQALLPIIQNLVHRVPGLHLLSLAKHLLLETLGVSVGVLVALDRVVVLVLEIGVLGDQDLILFARGLESLLRVLVALANMLVLHEPSGSIGAGLTKLRKTCFDVKFLTLAPGLLAAVHQSLTKVRMMALRCFTYTFVLMSSIAMVDCPSWPSAAVPIPLILQFVEVELSRRSGVLVLSSVLTSPKYP